MKMKSILTIALLVSACQAWAAESDETNTAVNTAESSLDAMGGGFHGGGGGGGGFHGGGGGGGFHPAPGGGGGFHPAPGGGGGFHPAPGNGGFHPAPGNGGFHPAPGNGGFHPAPGNGGFHPAPGNGGFHPAPGEGWHPGFGGDHDWHPGIGGGDHEWRPGFGYHPGFEPGYGWHDGPRPGMRFYDPWVVTWGNYPWARWNAPFWERPVYDWNWGGLTLVTCTAADQYGNEFPVTENDFSGWDYQTRMNDIEDQALDRCFAETQDPSCHFLSCTPGY
jgi:hypothetical protein